MWMIVLPPDGAARTVGTHLLNAFAGSAVTHTAFDMGKTLTAMELMLGGRDHQSAVDLANEHFAVTAFDRRITHVLVTALSPVTLFTLNLLRKYRIRTIHWFCEDFRRALYWQEVLPGYDCFAALQRGPVEDACRRRGVRFEVIDTAAGLVEEAVNHSPTFDLAFVGIPSPYRIAVLERLAEEGFSLVLGGHGWAGYRGPLRKHIVSDSWMNEAQTRSALRSARIGLNLSVADPAVDRENAQLSPRAFDTLAIGALLLTEESPAARRALAGCSFTTFTEPEELVRRAHELLDTFASMRELRVSNQSIVLQHHTYQQRAEAFIKMAQE